VSGPQTPEHERSETESGIYTSSPVEEALGSIIAAASLVQDAQSVVEDAKELLDRTVVSAREARVTWAEIGSVLGMSRQSAWERFSDKVKENLDSE
jgi:hypothetical protein